MATCHFQTRDAGPILRRKRVTAESDWETEAENWVRWVRTPGHDEYWYYRDGFFEAIVPPPDGRTLEIGCGEGRVVRDLVARGHRVTAVDTSPTLLRHARDEDSSSSYVLADGAALPFPDCSFTLAVAYNSLMDVTNMPGTVREAARVLDHGGHLGISVTHPIADFGRFTSDDPEAPFAAIKESYFARERFEVAVERDGLPMTFRGWTHTLEDYAVALEDAGLVIETIREPQPSEDSPRFARWRRVPLFLNMRAAKP